MYTTPIAAPSGWKAKDLTENTAHAQQLGIGTVYQEVNLLPNMSVADNLFIGREPKRFGLLRRKEMEKRATELMASYGFSLDVREPLNRFSVAMQQIVAICRAIDLSAKVLILDEPTASLDTPRKWSYCLT